MNPPVGKTGILAARPACDVESESANAPQPAAAERDRAAPSGSGSRSERGPFARLCAGLTRSLLPHRCLLCGQRADGRDLCLGCAGDLQLNRPCCARCALPLACGDGHALCGECLRRPPPFERAWVPFRYAHPLDLLETRFKFGADLAAGRVLAELLIERAGADPPPRPELVLPVPLHPGRLRSRGYNQALELARPLARALRLPLHRELLRRLRATPAQTGLDAQARRRNLRGAFAVAGTLELPRHVALVDDVMTTGSTLAECAQTLRRAGVARVDVWALARAPKSAGAGGS